jgi:large subunit ribosomal protein L35
MPKLKTHSGSKKRFKVTAKGHVKAQAAFKRNARGTMVLAAPDARILLKNFLRNA